MTSKKLQRDVHQALRSWHSVHNTESNLLSTLRLIRTEQDALADQSAEKLRRVTNIFLEGMLSRLEEANEFDARLLRMRFLERVPLSQVATSIHFSEDAVNRMQRSAIGQLAGIIASQEKMAARTLVAAMKSRLAEANYNNLVGLEEERKRLIAALLAPDAPPIHVVSGIGGIGKTALTDSVARELIDTLAFEDAAMVVLQTDELIADDARNPRGIRAEVVKQLYDKLPFMKDAVNDEQRMVNLRQRLQSRPHLIIIDNIESRAVASYLVGQLYSVIGAGRIVLTSREMPDSMHPLGMTTLSELSIADALMLLRQTARENNLDELAVASDEELQPIVQLTGGNPYAIKLVVQLSRQDGYSIYSEWTKGGGTPFTTGCVYTYLSARLGQFARRFTRIA